MNSFSAHIIIDDEVYEKTLTTDKKKNIFHCPWDFNEFLPNPIVISWF